MAERKNTYELTYIVNAAISDDQVKDLVQRVHNYIEENGGTVLFTDEWGNRRLSYPINKKRNGYYVNLYFEAPGDIIVRFERALEINDNILRYLTLRLDPKMMRHYEELKRRQGEAATAPAPADA